MISPRQFASIIRPASVLRLPKTSFHAASVAGFKKSSVPTKEYNVTEAASKALEHKSKSHGSYHWTFERVLAATWVPLIAGAAIYGSHPMIDFGFAIVAPIHSHIGLSALVVDYLPLRVYPTIYRLFTGIIYACTGLTMYGLYQFNTNDVGITEFVKRLWSGKVPK
ncbi:membrane anchor subunit of succinate dehydrogenase, Sdh4 [Nowakowskiella sp. JEL0407]|nr:membrane anchor subunit of succinate dehydrogenase, Sdh4 [Nowakowskiella sp. JEL0407]